MINLKMWDKLNTTYILSYFHLRFMLISKLTGLIWNSSEANLENSWKEVVVVLIAIHTMYKNAYCAHI